MTGTRQRSASGAATAVLSLGLLLGGPARADVNKLRAEVADLEQLAKNLGVRYRTQVAGTEQVAEHRLVDAQVLYTLQDYTRAAILLFDYVSKYQNTRGYPEALFYLADSLYHKRDYLSARRYFEVIVRQVRGKYYQEALQRLVELSLRTGDSTNVNEYLSALANIPPHMLQPSVPYVRGKYYYFKNQPDAALASFRAIAEGATYFMHAQYFIGAALVQKGDHAGALQLYQSLLRINPKTDAERHIRDLTHLALGRLLYEKGKIKEAIDMYSRISRKSPEFDTSLYEIAWAYIKSTEYQKALRALDLLVLAHPESPKIPDVKVLQGNLLIRLEQWGRATDLFSKAREKFIPVQTRMAQILREHNSASAFFDVLLARNLGQLGVTIQVPELAVSWVKEEGEVRRAIELVKDVREIQSSIKEAKELIARLEHAVNTPAKVKIFPEFAAAKASALEVENRLLLARKQIMEEELGLIAPVATGAERDQLGQLASRRAGLEQKVKDLPTTAAGYASREQDKLEKLGGLEKELSKMSVLIDSLQAQLVAAEKFYNDTQAGRDRKEIREGFRREVEGVRSVVTGLQTEADELRQLLTDARATVGVGGTEEVQERGVKVEYRRVMAQEHQLLSAIRSRLGGDKGPEFDTLSNLLARAAIVDSALDGFDKKLDAGVEEKLSTIRAALREEKQAVSRYTTESVQYTTETDRVAGAITYDGFQSVTKRFYDIIVRADVGIIDVAWALKDSKSKEVSRLVRQQKQDLKLLDDEFREVLKED